MANIRLVWQLPEVGSTQRAIQFTRIEFRELGASEWEPLDTVAPDVESQTVIQSISPGDYEFRGTVVDVSGASGPSSQAEIAVPFDLPGGLISFEAILE